MASTITRRPLPALISLVALLILTGIVWWRVVHRDDPPKASATSPSTPTCPTTGSPTTAPVKVTIAARSVTVRVLNSTERNGIGAKARTALIKDGFRVPAIAADDAPSVSISQAAQIRYGDTGRAGAELLQYYFPGSVLTHVKTTSTTVTVSLGDAYKGVASAASVKSALARATTPTTSPSGSPSSSPSPSTTAC